MMTSKPILTGLTVPGLQDATPEHGCPSIDPVGQYCCLGHILMLSPFGEQMNPGQQYSGRNVLAGHQKPALHGIEGPLLFVWKVPAGLDQSSVVWIKHGSFPGGPENVKFLNPWVFKSAKVGTVLFCACAMRNNDISI